jgi:S-formylglutathione hydrolase FrmB
MGLTSGLFISVLMIVAAGSLAATVWLWPKVAGRRLRDFGARLGLLAVCQFLVIAAFLAFINGYFSFFGSWPELFGTGAPPPIRLAEVGGNAKPVAVTATDLGPLLGSRSVLPLTADGALASKPPGPPPSPGILPTLGGVRAPDGPRPLGKSGLGRAGATPVGQTHSAASVSGEVLQVTIRGERSGIAVVKDYLYLPPQYFQPAYAHAKFPVVLTLTGYPNEPWSIVKRLAVPATAERLGAAKLIKPAIYLMMNVSPALPRDTECTNVPAGLQVFSFFAIDVPRAMEQTFRVQAGRTGWAVLGYSTGGYCAAKLAMMDPGQFSAAVSMAGYYNAIMDSTTGNLYGGSTAYQNENDLDWRLAHLPAPPVSVLVTSSRVGDRGYPGTLAFLRLIHPPMSGYSLILPQGGHNYRTWDRELPQSLEWLSKRLSPAVPQSAGAVQHS